MSIWIVILIWSTLSSIVFSIGSQLVKFDCLSLEDVDILQTDQEDAMGRWPGNKVSAICFGGDHIGSCWDSPCFTN